MSGSNSPWRYRIQAGDSGGVWHHPFSRLLHIVDQIPTSPRTPGGGIVHYFNHMQSGRSVAGRCGWRMDAFSQRPAWRP